eukprot:414715-Amphidinium_carterae.2
MICAHVLYGGCGNDKGPFFVFWSKGLLFGMSSLRVRASAHGLQRTSAGGSPAKVVQLARNLCNRDWFGDLWAHVTKR